MARARWRIMFPPRKLSDLAGLSVARNLLPAKAKRNELPATLASLLNRIASSLLRRVVQSARENNGSKVYESTSHHKYLEVTIRDKC